MEPNDSVKFEPDTRASCLWWNQSSIVKKILFIVVCLLLCLGVIIVPTLVVLHLNTTNDNDQNLNVLENENEPKQSSTLDCNETDMSLNQFKKIQEDDLCFTTACFKASYEILSFINTKVNPCDDFYRFSCGKWLDNGMIPNIGHGLYSRFENDISNKVEELIENINDDAPQYIRNIKTYYTSCIKIDEIERLGSEPLENMIQKLGGWPVVNDHSDHSFNWIETMTSVRKLGLDSNIFIHFIAAFSFSDVTSKMIWLGTPDFGLAENTLLRGPSDPTVSAYHKLMVNSAVMLGAQLDNANKEMLDVLMLEIKLAKISQEESVKRPDITVYGKDLQKLSPGIQWISYINAMINGASNNVFTPDDQIIVGNPSYIKQLSEILSSSSNDVTLGNKKKRTLQNYIIWRVVLQSMRYLSRKWRNLDKSYRDQGIIGYSRTRSSFCMETVKELLLKAVASMYIQAYVSPKQRQQARFIAKYVREAFIENLDKVKWVDYYTRQMAENKAKQMLIRIGYPDELVDNEVMSKYYANLHVEPMTYYQNTMNINKWKNDKYYADLKQFKRESWTNWRSKLLKTAFYVNSENALELSSGYFQGSNVTLEIPNYLNFASIGETIGHEMVHGFGRRAKRFDALGRLNGWQWSQEMESAFELKTRCLVYQYGNYSYPGINMAVNGVNTLNENIADNAGIKAAYRGYKNWLKKYGDEQGLPSLRYTSTQVFWIASALPYCESQDLESIMVRIMRDYHAPPYNRVNGVVSNSKEFSEDFNCPLGSPMNPVNKCEVW